MANNFYGAIGISGGSDGFLDNIDGTNLADADGTVVISSASNVAGLYVLDADAASAQAIPSIIQPDTNAGDKRWLLRALQATGLDLYEAGTTNLFQFSQSSGDVIMDNTYDGGTITLRGENTGNSILMVADPAGALSAYYAGVVAFTTAADGIAVQDTSGTTPIILLNNDAGTALGNLAASATTVSIGVGASFENAVVATLNGAVALYFNDLTTLETTAEGIEVLDSSGTAPAVDFRSDANALLSRIQASASALTVSLWNGSGWETGTVTILNGAVELYYDNIKEVETISGGLKATNSLTIASTTNVTGILDEDDLTSDSAVSLATQQSIKAYADNRLEAKENIIINGDFDIWQRGTSFPAVTNGYTADRFGWTQAGTMVVDITQSTPPTQAESGHESNHAVVVDVTTAAAVLGATNYAGIQYKIEGYDFAPLIGNYGTLSFWAKHTLTGQHCVTFRDAGGNVSYVAPYTVAVSDTWEKHTITVNFNDSIGTWLTTTGVGMRMFFSAGAGTTLSTATTGSWTAGNFLGITGMGNDMASNTNFFQIAQVKLERGTVATSWKARLFAEELALCQRYYEKSYDLDVVPGTASANESRSILPAGFTGTSYGNDSFKVSKVSTPTIVLYSPITGVTAKWYNYIGTADVAATTGAIGTNAFDSYATVTDTQIYGYHWTADAEL